MMNFNNSLILSVIENELRRTIKGVLSDIYFAHISTLFLENLIAQQIKEIGQETIDSLTKATI